jgi:hypothetical protein
MFTHHIRIDRVTHVVISAVKSQHRKGYTTCAIPITKDNATVLAPFKIGDDRRHDITCDTCMSIHTALEDVLDTDFGFATYDDGTGRFTGSR